MSFLAILTCGTVFACTSLIPGHPPSTESGAAPYKLTVNPTTYGPGDQIKVTISKTGAYDFRGIIVQTRSKISGSTAAVGTFSFPSTGTRLLLCGMTGDTWAHSDRSDKSIVTATWTAPPNGGEDLVFHYSIVQKNDKSGSVYFTGLMTDLTYMDGSDNSTTMPSTMSTTQSNAGYQHAFSSTTALVLFVISIFKQLL